MGKGKMASGEGHGKCNSLSHTLHASLALARETAYDHAAVEACRSRLTHTERRRLIFPHLKFLLGERVRADVREGEWHRQR
eukprot:CAMPEP_0173301146 /NCGR_PEP_ID=MMETSP1143-20121109/17629_1 /TAXON_ID=483371 /ORGANISM="non described non described, Strain CCMP2298" /LENGTH=80 /DNA_ID=CAMNT_0014241627 /DNA_START=130 /DNA_END=369 /DNA_ORIENTATION=+